MDASGTNSSHYLSHGSGYCHQPEMSICLNIGKVRHEMIVLCSLKEWSMDKDHTNDALNGKAVDEGARLGTNH